VSETAQRPVVGIDAYLDEEATVFRIEAADTILRLLVDASETEFTVPELVDATDVTRSTVWRAVDLLESIGAVIVRETPQRNYVAINPDRLQKADPILSLPQSEFHQPIREFIQRVETAVIETADIDELIGIMVFGSVARGEADRQSDIDLFVVVEGDRTSARRTVTDIVSTLNTERFDGDRYTIEPYVESLESAHRAKAKLQETFAEGRTVYSTESFQSLRKDVMADE